MGFQYPQWLQAYLGKKGDAPFETMINSSQYYSNTNAYVMTYLNRIVRQCMAYATATHDGAYNQGISTNIGYSAIKNAVKLIKGDKTLFNGDDKACKFLSDKWIGWSRFDVFLEEAITYMLQGGTCLIKLNKDCYGRCSLSASRIDRNMFTVNDSGDIVDALFFVTLLSSTKNGATTEQYWLTEHRYYSKGKPTIVYRVHRKSGTAGNETIPLIQDDGISIKELDDTAKLSVERLGVELNKPLPLPYKDGLGVWALLNTATNSCVPGLKMGDPALYGVLDLLWSIDTVFSGSLIDVLNGQGSVLLPKHLMHLLNEKLNDIQAKAGGKKKGVFLTPQEMQPPSENFVYVYTPDDKDFKPEAIQFDIRAPQYQGMWELYLKQFAVSFGYAPTTLFPYLQDSSPKTAREVTAEENLTRATVQSAHRLILPELNRAIAEVLYQHGFVGEATLQLSDYIGNKLMRDENLRQNYAAGLIPHETAVQVANGLSAAETAEYMEKIGAEQKETAFGAKIYDSADYFGG